MQIQLEDVRRQLARNTDVPVLAYCRQLISDGTNPETTLEVYRGEVLAIRVQTIRDGAKLDVKNGRFCRYGRYAENMAEIPFRKPVHALF